MSRGRTEESECDNAVLWGACVDRKMPRVYNGAIFSGGSKCDHWHEISAAAQLGILDPLLDNSTHNLHLFGEFSLPTFVSTHLYQTAL